MAGKLDLTIAELLCARLCHDLAGPIGGVATGAELLAEDGLGATLAGDAIALLAESAITAGARLRYLRLALGSNTQPVPTRRLRELAAGYLSATGGRVVLDWRDEGAAPFDPASVKLVLNLVLLAQDCLPRGGSIVVHPRQADGFAEVVSVGDAVSPGQAAAGLVAISPDGLSPIGAQGYYAAGLAATLDRKVEMFEDIGRIRFSAMGKLT